MKLYNVMKSINFKMMRGLSAVDGLRGGGGGYSRRRVMSTDANLNQNARLSFLILQKEGKTNYDNSGLDIT